MLKKCKAKTLLWEYGTVRVAFSTSLQWASGGTVAAILVFTRTDLEKVAWRITVQHTHSKHPTHTYTTAEKQNNLTLWVFIK